MANGDRISLDGDEDAEDDEEPFITGAEYIRERKKKLGGAEDTQPDRSDKSMNSRRSKNRNKNKRKDRKKPGKRSKRGRSGRRKQRTSRTSQSRRGKEEDSGGRDEDSMSEKEQAAVNKVIERLKQKGVSDQFIEENMDMIQEKARKELL